MAIKIIKNMMNEQPIEIECETCHSILSYTHSDIKKIEINVLGMIYYNKGFECPVCKNKVIIEKAEWKKGKENGKYNQTNDRSYEQVRS